MEDTFYILLSTYFYDLYSTDTNTLVVNEIDKDSVNKNSEFIFDDNDYRTYKLLIREIFSHLL